MTLEFDGANRLSETEVEFESIEPGQNRLDAFLAEFAGQVFIMLAQVLLMWGVIIGDQDCVVLDADIALERAKDLSGQVSGIPLRKRAA